MNNWHCITLKDTDFNGYPGMETEPIECEECKVKRPTAVYIWNSEVDVYLVLCHCCFAQLFETVETVHWMLNTTVTFPEVP